MPLIDNYLLDNYAVDGPNLSPDGLRSITENIPQGGSQSITSLGFVPLLLLVKMDFGNGARIGFNNLGAICWKGGNVSANATSYGNDSYGYYMSSTISVSNVVFSDNGVNFNVSASGYYSAISYTIFGI